MTTDELLNNFTGNQVHGLHNLDLPYEQDGNIVATNGHMMVMIPNMLLENFVIDEKVKGYNLPDINNVLCKNLTELDKRKFTQTDIDDLKLVFNYPYKALIEMSDILDYANDKIPFYHLHINFRYLILVELLQIRFKRDWFVYLPTTDQEQIVFTNHQVIYIVMPMAR